MSERVHVDPLDFDELIRHCFDLNDEEDIDCFLDDYAQSNTTAELCHELVRRLLPMVTVAESALAQKTYQAFAKIEGGSLVAIVKTPAERIAALEK